MDTAEKTEKPARPLTKAERRAAKKIPTPEAKAEIGKAAQAIVDERLGAIAAPQGAKARELRRVGPLKPLALEGLARMGDLNRIRQEEVNQLQEQIASLQQQVQAIVQAGNAARARTLEVIREDLEPGAKLPAGAWLDTDAVEGETFLVVKTSKKA